MTGFRRLLAQRRWLAAWLVAASLAVRVLVPGGYMPAAPGSLTLTICSGHMMAGTMAMPMPGADRHGSETPTGDHDRSDQPCPFAGLAMPSIAGADEPVALPPVVLPLARPVALLAEARAPPGRGFLRPPLRGPPALG